MRYCWLICLPLVLLLVTEGVPQGTKIGKAAGKDTKKKDKDAGKDKKKDPAKDPVGPEFKEPKEVSGKTFDQWRKEIKSGDPGKREVAMKMILLFGPIRAYDAIDDVLFELNKHKNNPVDLSVRVNGIMALSTIFKYKKEPDPEHVKKAFAIYKMFLKDPQVMLKMQTVKGLPFLGPIARDALDDVILLVRNPDTWEVRKEAIPILVILAAPLEKGGPPHPKAMIQLRVRVDLAQEPSQTVRLTALQGIALLSQPNVPADLYRALSDPSAQVRLTSLQSVGALAHTMSEQDKKTAKAKLAEYLLKEKDISLNMWTHATLMTLAGKVVGEDMKAIVNRVNYKDPGVRVQALQLICMLGKDAKPYALAPVLEAIHDSEVGVGVAAINATACMIATEAVPILEKIVKDDKSDDALHTAAVIAVAQFELHAKKLKEDSQKDKKDKGDKK